MNIGFSSCLEKNSHGIIRDGRSIHHPSKKQKFRSAGAKDRAYLAVILRGKFNKKLVKDTTQGIEMDARLRLVEKVTF